VGFALTHAFIVLRPVWIYWRQRRLGDEEDAGVSRSGSGGDRKMAAGSRRAFELVLTDSSLLEEFKRFAVKDFSVENVLFYERVAQFRSLPAPLPATNGELTVTSDHLAKEARKVYYLFLREHADLQLNLSSRVLRNIESDIRLKRFCPGMFDGALAEVVQLMWTDTYPRFVRDHSKDWRRDLARRSSMLSGGKNVSVAGSGTLVGIMGSGGSSAVAGVAAPRLSAQRGAPGDRPFSAGDAPRPSLTPMMSVPL